jgi:hypothetical protein
MSELMAIVFVFSIPMLAIWTHHKRKMMELQIKLRGQGDNLDSRPEIEALRQELRALRDTTTQYDLSFDTALQRMESRMEGVERQVKAIQSDDVLRVGNGR